MNTFFSRTKLTLTAFSIVVATFLSGCGGGGGAGSSGSTDYYAVWWCTGSQCATVMGGYNGTAGPFSSLEACEQWRKDYILTSYCTTTPDGGSGPAPTITSFAPAAGAPGTSVTITGTNFATNSSVTINGVAASVVSASTTKIVITIPAMNSFSGPFVVTAPGGNVTSGGNFTVTTPGVNWSSSATTGVFRSVAWSGSQYAAVGDNIITSPDAVAWTSRLNTVPVPALSGVAYKGGRFVAVGVTVTTACCFVGEPGGIRTSSSGTVLTTDNGITWTNQTSGTPAKLTSVTLSGSPLIISGPGSKFVTVGEAGVILTSPTGSAWTSSSSGATDMLNGIAWSASQSKFAAVGASGVVLTSPDGVTWGSNSSGTPNNLNGVAWCSNQFVAVGDVGTILTSPDGMTWTSRTSGVTDALYGVACSASQIVAVGAAGTIRTSPDGISWVSQTSGTSNTLYGITWSDGNTSTPAQFVAVGSGVILTSQ